MKYVINIFAFLILLSFNVGAVEINCPDCPSKTVKYIRQLIKSQPDSSVENMITAYFSDRAYLDVQIDFKDESLIINPGNKYYLNDIIINEDSSVLKPVGQLFTAQNLNASIDEVLESYYGEGYYYARATIGKITGDGDSVTVVLDVHKGPGVTLGEKIYTGLKRSDPNGIERYIPLDKGDTLTSDRIDLAEKSAAMIPYVNYYPPVKVHPQAGYMVSDLEFDFAEKKQFNIFGAVGYVPDDESGLVWSLDMKLRNLFGAGREASIYSERREKGRNILNIDYLQPFFLVGAGTLGVNVSTRDYRDEFYEFAVGGGYKTYYNPQFSTNLALGWKKVVPEGDLPAYNSYRVTFAIEREALDYPLNPKRGLKLGWSVDFSSRRYESPDAGTTLEKRSYNETGTSVNLDGYHEITGNFVGHLSLNYTGLETSESLPPLSELTFVGGPGTLRGYRNEQFPVLRTAYGTIEPRVRFKTGYLFMFYDGAYLNNRVSAGDETTKTDEYYRYSYGVGLSLNNPERAVKISLGWNPDLSFDQPRLSIEFSSDI